ncbi:MAG: branched-chain amino acid ABC transporter permease [Ruminococcaceae bacterium]|nr:branched-chain amino acid ABC transporter permease [Oscillospiraceae bacterium]
MQTFISTLIDGLSLGSLYALVALGYSMVYGIAKMLNFAHGDVIMIGIYTLFVTLGALGTSPLMLTLSALIMIVFCALLGFTIEKLAYKPLRTASPLSVLITAIGVSYLLQNIALLVFGSRQQKVPTYFSLGSIYIGGVQIELLSLLILAVTVLIMILLSLFINKTKLGSAMLAVSEDKGAAQLMGINVNATISLTFVIGSALAGVGALLYAAKMPWVGPYTGSVFGIKAFAAAVFGGIGSIPGAMIGGVLIGIIEAMMNVFLPDALSNASDGFAYLVLIIMLVLKPSGLLGRKQIEKV